MKTEGGSKRKLPEVEDPAASAGAIHCRLRRPANRRPAEMPRARALASASIPEFRWPGHLHGSLVNQVRSSGYRAPGAARA